METIVLICPWCGTEVKKWGRRYYCPDCKELFEKEDLLEKDPFLSLIEDPE